MSFGAAESILCYEPDLDVAVICISALLSNSNNIDRLMCCACCWWCLFARPSLVWCSSDLVCFVCCSVFCSMFFFDGSLPLLSTYLTLFGRVIPNCWVIPYLSSLLLGVAGCIHHLHSHSLFLTSLVGFVLTLLRPCGFSPFLSWDPHLVPPRTPFLRRGVCSPGNVRSPYRVVLYYCPRLVYSSCRCDPLLLSPT